MKYFWIVAWGAIICNVGCNRQDGEKLVKISQMTSEKIRDAAPSRTPFGDIAFDGTPAGRVRNRIRGDVYFQESTVQVSEDGDGIHLRGTVPTQEHLDRATQLAEQTVGVSRVINELTIRE